MMKPGKSRYTSTKGSCSRLMALRKTKGNETISLLRDVLTGRILHADNVNESTKDRLKALLAPVVTLEVPVIGVGSRCATHRITSGSGTVAWCSPSDLPISCQTRARAD